MNPLAIEFRNKWGLQETWMPEDARALHEDDDVRHEESRLWCL